MSAATASVPLKSAVQTRRTLAPKKRNAARSPAPGRATDPVIELCDQWIAIQRRLDAGDVDKIGDDLVDRQSALSARICKLPSLTVAGAQKKLTIASFALRENAGLIGRGLGGFDSSPDTDRPNSEDVSALGISAIGDAMKFLAAKRPDISGAGAPTGGSLSMPGLDEVPPTKSGHWRDQKEFLLLALIPKFGDDALRRAAVHLFLADELDYNTDSDPDYDPCSARTNISYVPARSAGGIAWKIATALDFFSEETDRLWWHYILESALNDAIELERNRPAS
jgi:hypothetical protein